MVIKFLVSQTRPQLVFVRSYIMIIIIIIMSLIDSEKDNGDKIDDRMLADRLLLQFKSSWEVHRNKE